MIAFGDGAQVQLLAPLSAESTIAQVPRPQRARAAAAGLPGGRRPGRRRAGQSGRHPDPVRRAAARHRPGRRSTSCTPRTPAGCWSNWSNRRPLGISSARRIGVASAESARGEWDDDRMSSNEWLPAQIPFDLVRRGFAPDQVTAHLERLEYDLRIATANGDATNQRLSEVSAQLHDAQAEADELRTQLDNLAREPVSMTGLSNRMQRMIRLAEEEAAEIRARANAEADKVTGRGRGRSTAATAAERETFDGERERTRRQLADQVRDLLAEANHRGRGRPVARAQQESQAALAAATAEAERLLDRRHRRNPGRPSPPPGRSRPPPCTAARDGGDGNPDVGPRRGGDTRSSSAREEAEALTAASTAERQRLDAEGNARRKAIDEDFEIAISSRRAEAHQRLTEREEISVADANSRIAEATAEAERRVAGGHRARRRADPAGRRRIPPAGRRRRPGRAGTHRAAQPGAGPARLAARPPGQVDKLAASAPALLDPPDTEANRPVTADFPADPAQRPTGLPASYDSEPGPWDDVTVESVRARTRTDRAGRQQRPDTERAHGRRRRPRGAGRRPELRQVRRAVVVGLEPELDSDSRSRSPRPTRSPGSPSRRRRRSTVPTRQRAGTPARSPTRAMGRSPTAAPHGLQRLRRSGHGGIADRRPVDCRHV